MFFVWQIIFDLTYRLSSGHCKRTGMHTETQCSFCMHSCFSTGTWWWPICEVETYSPDKIKSQKSELCVRLKTSLYIECYTNGSDSYKDSLYSGDCNMQFCNISLSFDAYLFW